MGAWFAGSLIVNLAGRLSDRFHWVYYGSFLSAYKPQVLIAHPEDAWTILRFQLGQFDGFGLGIQPWLLLGIGAICFAAGAIVFNRREIPAPL
jgi:hypothetical protein